MMTESVVLDKNYDHMDHFLSCSCYNNKLFVDYFDHLGQESESLSWELSGERFTTLLVFLKQKV